MKEEKGVAEIASAYTTFLADFHKRNPLFDYGSGSANDYDENLSLEENLERLDKNSEAYRILAQTTAEGIDAFRGISAKHAAYTPVGKVAQDIKGVPDGAKSAGVYYNPDDEDDPRNGKPMWQGSDGKYYVEEDEESQ